MKNKKEYVLPCVILYMGLRGNNATTLEAFAFMLYSAAYLYSVISRKRKNR